MVPKTYKEWIKLRDSLPHGAQKEIAKQVGISPTTISLIMNGQAFRYKRSRVVHVVRLCRSWKKRREPVRLDKLVGALPNGYQTELAKRLGVSVQTVNHVLLGSRTQTDKLGVQIIRSARNKVDRERRKRYA